MRRAATAAVAMIALAALTGCTAKDPATASPTPTRPSSSATSTATSTADVSEHESGPQSPILYGLEVPKGATQLGPLVRYRSHRLIQAYRPELDAVLAQQKADEEQKLREQAEEDGTTPATPTPTPTPTATPGDDTFAELDDPPRPDVTISLLRVDGSPTEVLRRLIAQINAVLPDAKLAEDDLSDFCQAKEQRITSCEVKARGLTRGESDIQITVSADPGDVVTRTARVASKLDPVMVVKIEYVGEPRAGQSTSKDDSPNVPRDVKGKDTSGLIWPRMDVEAPVSTKQLDGWTVPATSTILLSGRHPLFVALATERVGEADTIAREYAERLGKPSKDVVEDLNEISTTYRVKAKDGATATSTFVLSGRGSYVMIFYTPAP